MPKKQFKFERCKNIDAPGGFTNGERASMGDEIVLVHPDAPQCDKDTMASDAMCALLHWCDSEGVDVKAMIKRAVGDWEDER